MESSGQHIVVFSGAGMSAESGLKTFRDNDGLWENYEISDVATPQAWQKNKELVLEFYNMRRRQLFQAKPNAAHFDVAQLERKYQVTIVTQNIDDLHERAGSTNVLHLHGELKKVRSSVNPTLIYEWEKEDLNLGDIGEDGHQLRPHVVWFGEEVPAMIEGFAIAEKADLLIVIGTSLNVYPAAQLIQYVPSHCTKYLIDPNPPQLIDDGFEIIKDGAENGMNQLLEKLMA